MEFRTDPTTESPAGSPAGSQAAAPTRFARVRWPLIIVGMLSGHVTAMVLAVNVARGDGGETGNGHSVLPAYYERAVNWDEDRAAISRSEDLGWKVVISPAVLMNTDGKRPVTVEFRDASGDPLTGLLVHVKTWHHAIGEVIEGDGSPSADGTYRVELPMVRAGLWDFEVTATRGSDAFVSQSTVTINSAASLLGKPGR